jgi:hypothetical protein
MAQQRDEFSGLYFEGDTTQGRERAESFFDALEGNS